MTKFVGRQVKVGLAPEATRGAGIAPARRIPHASLSLDDKISKARSIAGLGNLADSEEAFVTNRFAQGNIEGELRMDSIGDILYGLFGSLSTSSVVDSAYTHSFSINHVVASKSLAIAVQDGNETEMYKMSMVDTLEIIAELDQVVMINAGFLSKAATDSGATLPAVDDEAKFVKKHVKVKLATDISGLAAASTLSLKRLRLQMAKATQTDDSLGTAEPEDIVGTQFAVEGEFEINYEDSVYKDYFTGGSERAMEVLFENADHKVGAGSTNHSLKLQFPKVDFFEWEPNYDLGEISKQTVSFKASYDVANAQDIVYLCQLVNSVSSY